ncbi:DNA repair protein RecN [Gleimia coleocanis DSM 15436]|uniref:DNA repair protein RecN n=1 Tax=Gleimia coleocanis DSM 15436 TaxID=525245 RepID=C0VZ83_9ACTO|nr:DNA repair protein RecN [Gleimia coleocanis]EEH64184.1 DNA repair protein RecN [Gleimia coleocanis DSM 15436]
MIEELHIRNLGVIAQASIEFKPGLTVLTGETGAGKTMLLTSLQLLLGQRADTGKIRAGEAEATVDGVFTVDEDLQAALGKNEIQESEDGILLIGRKISPTRSRSYLDRRPAPLNLLTDLGPNLAVIHGQAEQLNLKNLAYQREILDEFGSSEHQELVAQYQQAWKIAVAAKREKDAFEASLDDAEAEIQELTPVLQKIRKLNLEPGEEDSLQAEIKRIENAETLRGGLAQAHGYLSGNAEELGVVEAMTQAQQALRRIENYDPELNEISQRLAETIAQAQVIRDDLAYALHEINADPARLDALQGRRRSINQLLRGRAVDITGLLEWAETAEQKLAGLENIDDRLAELTQNLLDAQAEVLETGAALSASRAAVGANLEKLVDTELHGLAMPNAHFIVALKERIRPGPDGLEDIEMLLQPHPDLHPAPLAAGASGGELSRIMLALEVVLADRQAGENAGLTYIFDEIDAGIGGSAAREVGYRLARLAKHRQVLVVTHLAQVAAWADQQLVIHKEGSTTTVKPVENGERVLELARMLSGAQHSETAQAHAEELLAEAQLRKSER